MGLERGLIESRDPGIELTESVHGLRELAGDIGQQGFVVVIEPQILPGHRDAGAELRT